MTSQIALHLLPVTARALVTPSRSHLLVPAQPSRSQPGVRKGWRTSSNPTLGTRPRLPLQWQPRDPELMTQAQRDRDRKLGVNWERSNCSGQQYASDAKISLLGAAYAEAAVGVSVTS
jgi:hypothetical protein